MLRTAFVMGLSGIAITGTKTLCLSQNENSIIIPDARQDAETYG